MRVLLTCFEPFGGSTTNVSTDVAQMFTTEKSDWELSVVQLPVSFKRIRNVLSELIDNIKPDVILMLGQASKRANISIERIAVNLMGATTPDNDGFSPADQPIISGESIAFLSTFPLKQIVDQCKDENIKMDISNSAGLYVCNCAFYNALQLSKEKKLACKIGFIYLPKLENIKSQNSPLQYMFDAVKIALKTTE